MVVAGGWGNGKLLFNGYRVSVEKSFRMKRILEMDGGDGYKTRRMYT